MQSQEIPEWMRHTVRRDFVAKARRTHDILLASILVLFGIFLIIACQWAVDGSVFLIEPVVGASVCAFFAILIGLRQSNRWSTIAYLSAAITANASATYIVTVNYWDPSSDSVTVAGSIVIFAVILFTGLIGLLMFLKVEKRIPKLMKVAIMAFVALALIMGMNYVNIPSEGLYRYLQVWLFAAIFPMTFLTVMTFGALVAYSGDDVTVPSDKWI